MKNGEKIIKRNCYNRLMMRKSKFSYVHNAKIDEKTLIKWHI